VEQLFPLVQAGVVLIGSSAQIICATRRSMASDLATASCVNRAQTASRGARMTTMREFACGGGRATWTRNGMPVN
jgi:hypothetical protein